MLVRVGPQVQTVLRIVPDVTGGFDTGDQSVNLALRRLAEADPKIAMQAEAAHGSLTWGNGLPAVSLRGLQDFLWYQLPVKWATSAAEHHHIAHALGALFQRVNLPRYTALCTGPITADVLNAYRAGDQTGMLAYRRALDAGGVEPPDLPDLLSWGAVGPDR